MAWTLRLNKAGSTTALIGSGNAYLTEEYVPVPPSQTMREILDAIATGRESELSVTETLEMAFVGTTQADLDNKIEAIKLLMSDAELYTLRRKGNPVYLEMTPDGTSTLWRTQILAGRLEYDANWHRTWVGNKVKARLHIERIYFWEHSTEAEASLSSVTGTGTGTGGKTIENHYVSTEYGNFVTIGASGIDGTIPTPARISMQNTSGGELIYRNIYIANETVPNGATLVCEMKQGENKQGGSTGTVQTSQVGESDESNLAVTVSGTASPRWAYTAAQISSAAGNTYRVLVRFSFYNEVPGNTIFVEPQLNELLGGWNLNPWQMEVPLNGLELIDVGSISFGDYRSSAGMSLVLKLRSEESVTVEIDYIQLMPADNFRWLIYQGEGVPDDEYIVDDGPENRAYQLNASNQQVPVVDVRGNPIMLYPGWVNRLYFLHDTADTQAPVEDETTVRVYYRPRRLTV